MAVEEIRMMRCDDCGKLETMPPIRFTSEEVVVPIGPDGWLVAILEYGIKTYCPECKFLH
jgi:hypothetical protein